MDMLMVDTEKPGGPFPEGDIGQPGTPKQFPSPASGVLNHSKARETEAPDQKKKKKAVSVAVFF